MWILIPWPYWAHRAIKMASKDPKWVIKILVRGFDIIKHLESGKSWKEAMISYNIGSSTSYDIKKQKDQLQSFMTPSKSVKKLKVRWSNSSTGLDRNLKFQEAEVPRFPDNWHIKVVRLSTLHTGPLYPHQGNFLGSHFCQRLSWSQGHSMEGWKILVTPSGIKHTIYH
jgi:hypothetical protein